MLATNTSSISITAIAAGLARPENVVGMHFFNPAPLMALVEVVMGQQTATGGGRTRRSRRARSGRKPPSDAKARRASSSTAWRGLTTAKPFACWRPAEPTCRPSISSCAKSGAFLLGTFRLLDLIGLDVNLMVTRAYGTRTTGTAAFAPA